MAQKKRTVRAKATAVAGRRRKPTKKQAKLAAKLEARRRARLANIFELTAGAFKICRRYWKPLGGIVLVYLVLNIVFASGIGSINVAVNNIKDELNNSGVHAHPLTSGLTGLLSLIASAGSSSSSTSAVLQVCLMIVESLVIIWALRQLLANKAISVKQAYYSAMTPLIPFLLVVLVILIQLLPVTFGSAVISAIAVSLGTLSAFWSVTLITLLLLLATWSLYMLSASIFAIYIVTLPDMKPMAALRSAKNLVRFRRGRVLTRLLFLPVVIFAVMAAVIVPLILYATFFVTPVFFILGMLTILFVHTYLYNLYRELLG